MCILLRWRRSTNSLEEPDPISIIGTGILLGAGVLVGRSGEGRKRNKRKEVRKDETHILC